MAATAAVEAEITAGRFTEIRVCGLSLLHTCSSASKCTFYCVCVCVWLRGRGNEKIMSVADVLRSLSLAAQKP
jgi:hypothetical protein